MGISQAKPVLAVGDRVTSLLYPFEETGKRRTITGGPVGPAFNEAYKAGIDA
jgi:hypothetical protein